MKTSSADAEDMASPKQLARITGVFYLLVGIFGGFAEGFVDPKMYVAGDAAATAGKIVANSGLVRAGVIAHLLDATFYILTAMAFYVLFLHVQKTMARALLVFAALSVSILTFNTVFHYEALQVATDASWVTAFGAAGSNALVLLLVDIHHYGTLSAQVFFGLWLAPMGYLAYKSGLFPKALGVVLIAAAVCYLVDLLIAFLIPEPAKSIHLFLSIVPAMAEIWMVVYLLVKGVRSPHPTDRAPIAASG